MTAAGYAKETEGGYEKSTRIDGNPGFEKWSRAETGELNVLVNDRFIVEVEIIVSKNTIGSALLAIAL